MECTYDELRRDECLADVEDNLFAEQGGICAYTGIRLGLQPANSSFQRPRDVGFHIEHLTPQQHCEYGGDADYANMIACWPRPNIRIEPEYGARKKGNWPPPAEAESFVSPLRKDCSSRFEFNHRGEIKCSPHDMAATETIRNLGLDHKSLVELRRKAIQGALSPCGKPLTLQQANKLLATLDKEVETLDAGGRVHLMEFCFAIRPALVREIRKLEGIRGSRRQ